MKKLKKKNHLIIKILKKKIISVKHENHKAKTNLNNTIMAEM